MRPIIINSKKKGWNFQELVQREHGTSAFVCADASQLPECRLYSLTSVSEGRAKKNKRFPVQARLNGRGIATLWWDCILWFLQNQASHTLVMGHWDVHRWKQKMFPPQPLSFPSPAFCVFSLFIACLLTVHSTSLEDREEIHLAKCLQLHLQRVAHMKYAVGKNHSQDPTCKYKAGSLERCCPFPEYISTQEKKVNSSCVVNCSRAKQID